MAKGERDCMLAIVLEIKSDNIKNKKPKITILCKSQSP